MAVARDRSGSITCTVYLMSLLIRSVVRQGALITNLLHQGRIFISGSSDNIYYKGQSSKEIG